MAECFRGQASVAHRLLEQCAQGVPELVGVKRRDPEPVCELAADVLCAGDGQPVGAGGFGAASSTGSEQRIKHVPLHLTGGVVGGAGAAQRRRESRGTDPETDDSPRRTGHAEIVQLEWNIDAWAVPFNMSNPLVSDHPAAQLHRNGHQPQRERTKMTWMSGTCLCALIWCRRGPGLGADQVADAPADLCMTVGV